MAGELCSARKRALEAAKERLRRLFGRKPGPSLHSRRTFNVTKHRLRPHPDATESLPHTDSIESRQRNATEHEDHNDGGPDASARSVVIGQERAST
jgi:hypothetical protein